MNDLLYFNNDFNRFEILKEAKCLSKNELKELSFRERKILNVVIKNKAYKEKKHEIKLKNHLDGLIQHKPIERNRITRIFFEVRNQMLQLATGNLYQKLHPGLNLSQARIYEADQDMIYSFASDVIGKPQDHLIVEGNDGNYSILDYDTKTPLLKVKILNLETAAREASSSSFFTAGKIAGRDDLLMAF